ncbi:MAG: hypothetical protein AAGA48_35295 [Myxococcota bacterium]
MGSELLDAIAKVRGGHAFTLFDEEDVDRVFGRDFSLITTPLAYDFVADAEAASDWTLIEPFAVPLDGDRISLGASALFASRNNGGIGALFEPLEPLAFGEERISEAAVLRLAYTTPGNKRIEDRAPLEYQLGTAHQIDGVMADDLGVFKMAILRDEILALDAAAAMCEGGQSAEEALTVVGAAQTRASTAAMQLEDPGLEVEAQLLSDLATLVEAPAPSCAPPDRYLY